MEVYYKNETLFVDVTSDMNVDTLSSLERKVFRIIEDYGIDKIIISIYGMRNKDLLNQFKRNYYQKYKGFLLIR